MRVSFNAFTDTLINRLGTLNSDQVALQRQLSSGQLIEESYEDPFAMGRALETTTEKARIQTQSRNLNRAQLIGEFSGETLEQLKVISDKATIDANNTDGLSNSADYRARALQTNQLIEQALRVANAQISGDYLFAGGNSGEQPFVAERYEQGDFRVDINGVEIRELQDTPNSFLVAELDGTGSPTLPLFGGVSLDPTDATQVVFVDAANGFMVDAETGEATADPPVYAENQAPPPPYVIEWASANSGRLKEWDGSNYDSDATDDTAAVVGDVTTVDSGGPLIAQASPIDPATIQFVNTDGNLVDATTGEETLPATAASTLGGTPSYVIEWTAENTGMLKQWDGTDYSNDATDADGDPHGEVTIANNGTADFISRVSKVAISEEMVGMVSYITYTGTTSVEDDIAFRVGEGATISPFSQGSTNLNYLNFFNDMVQARDAYIDERLAFEDPDVTHTGRASAVEELIPAFTEHQSNVLLGIVEFGSLLQGIEVTEEINNSRFAELERLISAELDIDVAQTIVKLNRTQIAYEAALTSGSRLLGLSLLDYI